MDRDVPEPLCLCVCSVIFNFKMFSFKLFCVSNLFISSVVTELSPVWKRAANSAYHLQFCCLLRYVCPSFHLMFGMGFGF